MNTAPKRMGEEVIDTLGLEPGKAGGKRKKKWFALGVVALGLLSSFLVMTRSKPDRELHFTTAPVTRGSLEVIVTATGNLTPTNEVDVGCELSGIVRSVEVDYNDHVTVGQVLARLDGAKYEAAVTEATAALASARARLQQAEATARLKENNLKRLRTAHRLSGGKAPSLGELELADADVQRARADVTAAEAAVEQAQARLEIDRTNLAKTIIYSPINGVVLNRNVDPGQTVAASLQAPVLFTLADDLRNMELQVDVDEADVGLVKEGQSATFTVEAHIGRIFKAQIAQLRYGSQITNGVVTYTTLLKVDNADLALRPGMTATARIVASSVDDAVLVPNASLRFTPPSDSTGKNLLFDPDRVSRKGEKTKKTPDKQFKIWQTKVWVLEDNLPVAVNVNLGISDGARTVISEGEIWPGMMVITEAKYGS